MDLKKQRYRRVPAPDSPLRINVFFEDFHRLSMKANYEYPIHCHDGYEAIVVESGIYRCSLNKSELQLRRGQALLIKPGDEHQDHLRKGQSHYVLHFHLNCSNGGLAPLLFSPRISPCRQIANGISNADLLLIKEIQYESMDRKPYGGSVQDGLLSTLFWRWVRCLPLSALGQEYRSLLDTDILREKIAHIFNRHLENNSSMTLLASQVKVSPRQLTNHCRKLFGQSPARLLLGMKIARAESMLRYQGLRVNEVSDILGFANPFHFSRAFCKTAGYPPSSVLRARHRK